METRFYSIPRIAFKRHGAVSGGKSSAALQGTDSPRVKTPDRGSQAGGGDPEPRARTSDSSCASRAPLGAARGGAAGVPGAPALAGLRAPDRAQQHAGHGREPPAPPPRAHPLLRPGSAPRCRAAAGRVSLAPGSPPVLQWPEPRPLGAPRFWWAGAGNDPGGTGPWSAKAGGWRRECAPIAGPSVSLSLCMSLSLSQPRRSIGSPLSTSRRHSTRESCCGPGVSKRWRISRLGFRKCAGPGWGPPGGSAPGLEGSGSTHFPTWAHRGRERCAEPHGSS